MIIFCIATTPLAVAGLSITCHAVDAILIVESLITLYIRNSRE